MNWIYQDPNNHNFGMTSTSLLIEVRPTAISSFWRVFETCTPTLWIPVNYGGLENVLINLKVRCLVAGLPVSFWVNFWDSISISGCKVLLQHVLIYCIVCSDLSFPCMETCKGAGIPPLVCSLHGIVLNGGSHVCSFRIDIWWQQETEAIWDHII